MAISNTNILIKRSSTTASPGTLRAGEVAYSYLSNTLFLGNSTGTGVINIGGLLYTQTIDAATNLNTAGTLVKRDASGNVAVSNLIGNVTGNAFTAEKLLNGRNFSISGGDITAGTQAFDGTGAVVLNASLTSFPNITAGNYGSSTAIPVINVAANGRVTNVSTATISTSFTISGNSGGTDVVNTGETLGFVGANGSGINTIISNNLVTFNHDATVLRSNTTTVGPQVINTDLTVTGNLYIQGNTTSFNISQINIADPLIYLAANNYVSDVVDIGFAGNYFDGTRESHTGFFRDATLKQYFLFDNYAPELSGNNQIDTANSTFRLATLRANLQSGMISALANTIGIFDGGTNNRTYTNNTLTFFNGSAIVSLANVTSAYTNQGSASYVPVTTTDAFGRVTNITNTAIAIDASAVTSGVLPIARGGTNNGSLTNGLVYYNGTQLIAAANVTAYSAQGSASYVPVVTTNALGQVTSIANTAIAIDASAIVSGTLGVARGGTGNTSFITNGIIFGNGTGAAGVTNAAGGAADQTWSNQILTVTNAGVPVWSSAMDGGTF